MAMSLAGRHGRGGHHHAPGAVWQNHGRRRRRRLHAEKQKRRRRQSDDPRRRRSSSQQAPDKAGKLANIVLGFDDLAGYESDRNQYFGCTVGRVCNRIARGKFKIDDKEYKVALNKNDPNHLQRRPQTEL